MSIEYVIGIVAGVLLHEAGHAGMTIARGLKIREFGLTWIGPYVRREAGNPVDNALITAAGPGVNIALTLLWPWLPDLAYANLVVAAANLIPVPPFDGGRLIRHLLQAGSYYLHRKFSVAPEIVDVA